MSNMTKETSGTAMVFLCAGCGKQSTDKVGSQIDGLWYCFTCTHKRREMPSSNPVADIAVDVSRLIHTECAHYVPHDIGLKVMNLILERYHFHLSSGGKPDEPRYTRNDVMAFVSVGLAVGKKQPGETVTDNLRRHLELERNTSSELRAMPHSDGTVGLEQHQGGFDIEIDVDVALPQEKAGCALCAEGMNSFADPATGNRMHARNGVVTVCTAQNGDGKQA